MFSKEIEQILREKGLEISIRFANRRWEIKAVSQFDYVPTKIFRGDTLEETFDFMSRFLGVVNHE